MNDSTIDYEEWLASLRRRRDERVAIAEGVDVADPPHLRSDAPCAWCGAEWFNEDDPGDANYYGDFTMTHADDCEYLAAVDSADAEQAAAERKLT